MSRIDMQALVNAQVEINRALFIANARNNRQHHKTMTDEELSEDKVIDYAKEARKYLDKALVNSDAQADLFRGAA